MSSIKCKNSLIKQCIQRFLWNYCEIYRLYTLMVFIICDIGTRFQENKSVCIEITILFQIFQKSSSGYVQ